MPRGVLPDMERAEGRGTQQCPLCTMCWCPCMRLRICMYVPGFRGYPVWHALRRHGILTVCAQGLPAFGAPKCTRWSLQASAEWAERHEWAAWLPSHFSNVGQMQWTGVPVFLGARAAELAGPRGPALTHCSPLCARLHLLNTALQHQFALGSASCLKPDMTWNGMCVAVRSTIRVSHSCMPSSITSVKHGLAPPLHCVLAAFVWARLRW